MGATTGINDIPHRVARFRRSFLCGFTRRLQHFFRLAGRGRGRYSSIFSDLFGAPGHCGSSRGALLADRLFDLRHALASLLLAPSKELSSIIFLRPIFSKSISDNAV